MLPRTCAAISEPETTLWVADLQLIDARSEAYGGLPNSYWYTVVAQIDVHQKVNDGSIRKLPLWARSFRDGVHVMEYICLQELLGMWLSLIT